MRAIQQPRLLAACTGCAGPRQWRRVRLAHEVDRSPGAGQGPTADQRGASASFPIPTFTLDRFSGGAGQSRPWRRTSPTLESCTLVWSETAQGQRYAYRADGLGHLGKCGHMCSTSAGCLAALLTPYIRSLLLIVRARNSERPIRRIEVAPDLNGPLSVRIAHLRTAGVRGDAPSQEFQLGA